MEKALDILGYIRNNDYIMDLLDKTDVDEAISELEALQSRSCDGCKHFRDDNHAPIFDGYCVDVGTYIEGENELLPLDVDRGFCCSRYEAKTTNDTNNVSHNSCHGSNCRIPPLGG